ncbi:FG-GAP-like repeat-containing protein [Polaribacter sejongensis]|uniref:FG-GAP-like repeat-containing protein n=1 Tax=Polaribacter sejongensis TaxID=985043 RepID=UPI0035A6ACA8
MKRTLLTIILLYFIGTVNGQNITLTTSTTSIADHESLDITATLDTPTSKDVTINFGITGTATYDEDYTTDFAGKGTATTVAGGNGEGAAANQLYAPRDISVDVAGNIYILDYNNNRIQKWENGAVSATTVVNLPTGNVTSFFIDSENNIFISVYDDQQILKWSASSSTWLTVVDGNEGEGGTLWPEDISVDLEGNIYVLDGMNGRVKKWAPGSTSGITVAGGNGYGSAANQLSFSTSFFVDTNGNIFIADSSNRRIQKWEPGATEGITVLSSPETSIRSIFGADDGVIYFMYDWNAGGVKIKKLSIGSNISILVNQSEYGSALNEVRSPSGFLVDNKFDIYIADAGNNRIQKILKSPKIIIKAGETEGKLTITGIEDGSDEDDETIIITPTEAINGVLNSTSPITITLTDVNDPPVVTLAFSAPKIVENSATDVVLTATLSAISGKDVNITLTTEGTATENTEYTVSSKILTIPAGNSSGSISISTTGLDDSIVEIQETIIFKLTTIENATAVSDIVTLILESDDNPSVSLTTSTTSIAEHESLDITATLDAPTSEDVIINLDLSGTALNDIDYNVDFIGKGIATTVAGGNGEGSALDQFSFPGAVFVDLAGNIYVADRSNDRIQKWAPGATEGITVAGGNGSGSAANQFYYPNGLFVDLAGNIYVADRSNDRIQKWAPGATEGITVAGGNGEGGALDQFSNPDAVFVDLTGNIYVADRSNDRIQKWAPGATEGITVAGGNGSGSAANQFYYPNGLFVDLAGNIYVADGYNHRIQKWAPGATEGITVAGGNGEGSALDQFSTPSAVFVDLVGNIYVADGYNYRIQKWAPGATEGITVAGGNGSGDNANQLNVTSSVFVDLRGNIFVSDSERHRIQKYQYLPQIIIKAGDTTGTLTISGNEDDVDNEGTETIIVKTVSAENAEINNVLDITISLLDNTKSFTLQTSPFPGLSKGDVAWGDYDNDGDLDVAIMGQSPTSGAVTALYQNEKGVFVNTNQNFVKLYDGDITWVDINKDGWIDLVVSGYYDKPYTKLYINKEGSYFEPTDDYGLPQLYATTMAWGDLDNDGDIDLAIAGLDVTDNYSFNVYYREDNQNTFTKEIDWEYLGFINGDMKIIDIDLDGDNDIVYNGENSGGSPIGGNIMNTLINPDSNSYLNVPVLKNSTIEIARINNTIENNLSIITSGEDSSGNIVMYGISQLVGIGGTGTETQYPKLKKGDIAVADYNIDGLNDIVFTGENQVGVPITQLYIQDSNGGFKEAPLDLQGLRNSTATWVDYDMDGDLDLFLTGEDNTGAKSILYESEIANKKNTSPSKITGLTSENLGNGKVRFSWETPEDDFSSDLSYVLRLGITPGGSELSNTESDLVTGRRLISKPGQIYTNFFETQLDPGVYYWSVQAVDNGLKGSSFSDESTFTLTYEWKVLNQGGIVDRRVNGLSNPRY